MRGEKNTMKSILVIDQYYYPEPFRVTSICERLAAQGYDVQVVTGTPNYPEGNIYPGYEGKKFQDEIRNGVKIHRCAILPRKKGPVFRVLNYYSFVLKARRYILSKKFTNLKGTHFDVVYVNETSPIMMAEPAIAYKKRYKVPILLYCLDLWPDSLIAGGIRPRSLIYKYYQQVSKRIYENMDLIMLASQTQIQRLVDGFNISIAKIRYVPQYAEEIFNNHSVTPRHSHKFKRFLFAGNIGKAQSIDTIIKAAAILRDKPIRIEIVGGGSELYHAQEMVRLYQLENVFFYGRQPLSAMPEYYAQADAMLVTLKKNSFLSLTLPGKVQSYMAAGKPIIGAIDGETSRIIQKANCGYCGPAEDADELAHNIKAFLHNSGKKRLGKNAREFFEKEFSEVLFFKRFNQCLRQLS